MTLPAPMCACSQSRVSIAMIVMIADTVIAMKRRSRRLLWRDNCSDCANCDDNSVRGDFYDSHSKNSLLESSCYGGSLHYGNSLRFAWYTQVLSFHSEIYFQVKSRAQFIPSFTLNCSFAIGLLIINITYCAYIPKSYLKIRIIRKIGIIDRLISRLIYKRIDKSIVYFDTVLQLWIYILSALE